MGTTPKLHRSCLKHEKLYEEILCCVLNIPYYQCYAPQDVKIWLRKRRILGYCLFMSWFSVMVMVAVFWWRCFALLMAFTESLEVAGILEIIQIKSCQSMILEPNPVCHLFSQGLCAKKFFLHLLMVGKTIKRKIIFLGQMTTII